MSIEQAKATLLSTAYYCSAAETTEGLEEKLQVVERIYRRFVDTVGFDTPERTVMRRLSAQIERQLRSPESSSEEGSLPSPHGTNM